MGKNYNDLSRRGLIKLSMDYDAENEGALLDYLTKNGDRYEDIRPVEKIIERADQVSEIAGNAGRKIMAVLEGGDGDILDDVIDTITSDIVDVLTQDISESLG